MEYIDISRLSQDLPAALEKAKEDPIAVTIKDKPTWVILDMAEFVELKHPQKALWAHEVDDEWKERLKGGFRGRKTPEYDDIDK